MTAITGPGGLPFVLPSPCRPPYSGCMIDNLTAFQAQMLYSRLSGMIEPAKLEAVLLDVFAHYPRITGERTLREIR